MLTVTTAIAALVACLMARPRLRGTTLTAAWWWALAALIAVAGTHCLRQVIGSPLVLSDELRFAAAASTFCPVMALLGAKRPHNGAWQFVVAGLLVVLVLPNVVGGRAFLSLELHPAVQIFVVLLVAVGFLNGAATRHWPSAVLLSLAQVALLYDWLGLLRVPLHAAWQTPTALGLAATALWMWWLDVPRARGASHPVDRAWLDFRDAFGLLWGLRVCERFNAAAEMYHWPVRLRWSGLVRVQEANPPSDSPHVDQALRQTLENLLRRFVDDNWIAARLGHFGRAASATKKPGAAGQSLASE